jgi:hypothetical protein
VYRFNRITYSLALLALGEDYRWFNREKLVKTLFWFFRHDDLSPEHFSACRESE